MHLQKGHILISEPFLQDEHFARSVVLLCEYTHENAFGFILNQATELTISDVMEDLETLEDRIYIGGPVASNTLHFIHRSSERIEGDVEILENVYWGGNFEQLIEKIQERTIGTDDVRFFLGYSGWAQGQLAQELEEKSWIVGETNSSSIFETQPEQFWRASLKNMGGKYKMYSNFPSDPRLN